MYYFLNHKTDEYDQLIIYLTSSGIQYTIFCIARWISQNTRKFKQVTFFCSSLNCITNSFGYIKQGKLGRSNLLTKNNLQQNNQTIISLNIEITSTIFIKLHLTYHIWMRLEGTFQSNMRCFPSHQTNKIVILKREKLITNH